MASKHLLHSLDHFLACNFLFSSCTAVMDLEAWRQRLFAQYQEFLHKNNQDDAFMDILVDQLGDLKEFEVHRGRHGGLRLGKQPNLH